MESEEVPLQGGRVTAGVVQVGETVRRPIKGDRAQVHDLLTHLEHKGFAGTPRFLGVDDKNREILSFLPGEVPRDLGDFSDAQLLTAAALLRRFHDATADFPAVRDGGAEVMCHNDWGPPNCVFRDGLPYGLIDFDTIAPGMRLWDLGYSAFSWLDLGNPDYAGEEQVRRLDLFAEGYGLPACTPSQIAAYALARQTTLASWAKLRGMTAMAEWAASTAEWTALHIAPRLLPTGFPPSPRVQITEAGN